MRNEIIKMFAEEGFEVAFFEKPPEGMPENRPVAWVGDGKLNISIPLRAHDFDVAYVACEALAISKSFMGINGLPSEAALANSWALRKAISIYGSNDRVIEILKGNISWMFSKDLPAAEVAYVLWSRMAAADTMEMLGPIRKSRPEVADMIEKIDQQWHIPEDARDASEMSKTPPVPDPYPDPYV